MSSLRRYNGSGVNRECRHSFSGEYFLYASPLSHCKVVFAAILCVFRHHVHLVTFLAWFVILMIHLRSWWGYAPQSLQCLISIASFCSTPYGSGSCAVTKAEASSAVSVHKRNATSKQTCEQVWPPTQRSMLGILSGLPRSGPCWAWLPGARGENPKEHLQAKAANSQLPNLQTAKNWFLLGRVRLSECPKLFQKSTPKKDCCVDRRQRAPL